MFFRVKVVEPTPRTRNLVPAKGAIVDAGHAVRGPEKLKFLVRGKVMGPQKGINRST